MRSSTWTARPWCRAQWCRISTPLSCDKWCMEKSSVVVLSAAAIPCSCCTTWLHSCRSWEVKRLPCFRFLTNVLGAIAASGGYLTHVELWNMRVVHDLHHWFECSLSECLTPVWPITIQVTCHFTLFTSHIVDFQGCWEAEIGLNLLHCLIHKEFS